MLQCTKSFLEILGVVDGLYSELIARQGHYISPFVVGTTLCDALTIDTIELPDIFAFKTRLQRLNKGYVDLLK